MILIGDLKHKINAVIFVCQKAKNSVPWRSNINKVLEQNGAELDPG